MGDLISRIELLNVFNNKNIQITFDLPVEEILGEDVDLDDFAMLVQDAIQAYKKMVIDTIKNQPTAYDIDKVVEDVSCRCYEMGLDESQTELIVNEIVKQGGVSDDVCEAKQGRWVFDKFTAKYGKPYRCNCCSEEFGDTYKYCPNCGVSMKEVE